MTRARARGAVARSADPAPGHRLDLERQRDDLYRRLERGYTKIELGLASGEPVTTWEELWIALLRQYEAVCDELDAARAA